MVKITNWAIYTVAAHGRNSSLYADIGSAVNRPTVNRGLMDGRPADRSTGPTKIVDRPNKQKKARSARRQLGRPWVNVSNPGAKWLRFCSWLKFYNNNNKKSFILYMYFFFFFFSLSVSHLSSNLSSIMPNKRRKRETLLLSSTWLEQKSFLDLISPPKIKSARPDY